MSNLTRLTLIWNVLSLVVGTVVNDVGTVTVTTVSAVPTPSTVTTPAPPPAAVGAPVPLVIPVGCRVETPLTGGQVNSVQSCFITGSAHTKSEMEEEEKENRGRGGGGGWKAVNK